MVAYKWKRSAIVALFSALCGFSYAQVGINGAYRSFDPTDWLLALSFEQGADFSSVSGYSVGIDYWFRLKEKRIEFLPEISYSRFEQSSGIDNSLTHTVLGFHFNTNIYLFDLSGDCNCPTFSKSGDVFAKGFFLQISPGVIKFDNTFSSEVSFSDAGIAWEVGGGAGLDIGVTDLITVTPLVKFYYTPNATWEDFLSRDVEPTDIDSGISQLYAGIRLGFRING